MPKGAGPKVPPRHLVWVRLLGIVTGLTLLGWMLNDL